MTEKKTILTVDDSRTIRDMLRLTLSASGYRVVQAEDGLQGLEMLEAEGADVIITDINMPRLDGFGFIERVRADERRQGIPILVLTTETTPAMKERARAAGATGWISKPFDPDHLTTALRRVGA